MTGFTISNEEKIAGMLNLFEYLDYHMGVPGMNFEQLVKEAEQYIKNSPAQNTSDKEAFLEILNSGLNEIPGLKDLRLSISDHGRGIEADAFISDRGDAYVVYRGTGDGKWIDNGRGMTAELTESQAQASSFYDRVVEKCGLDDNTNLIVTGHSKGGNNAQAVTLNANHRELIDKCISFDGQGMSDKAVKRYRDMPGYEEQLEKMYEINGKHDVVNELGIKVIPNGHTIYIETNTDASELVETHAMQYMYQREDGTFGCELNGETSQGELGRYAHRLSEILMNMPEELRESCAVAIMQLIELPEEMKIGYDGDHASWSDMSTFLHYGLPTVIYTIIGTDEGRDALCEILKDAVSNMIEKYGVWETMGVFAGTVMLSPILLPILGYVIEGAAVILSGVTMVVDMLAVLEKIGEILDEIGRCIQQCLEAIEEFFAQIGDWIRHKVTGRPIIDSAEFSVRIEALHSAADELDSMKRLLQRTASEVNRVQRSLPMKGIAASVVKMQLNFVTLYVNQIANHSDIMERALDQTVNTYERYERQVVNNV